MRIKKLKKGFEKLTIEKARLIAHLIGDGAHYKSRHNYVLKYEVRDQESLQQFNDDIITVYGLKPSWFMNTSGFTGKPIQFVELKSILAYGDLFRYATYFSKDWKIKSPVLKAPLRIKKEFLKALFDDEGSVSNRYVIYLYSINRNGLLQVKRMLTEFNIGSELKSGFGCMKNVYALHIRDLKSFYRHIGFNLKRKQEKLAQYVKS